MEHNGIRHRLSEYIDGSVSGEERAAIDAHLETCLQCRSALEELRKTIEHIKTIEETEPPAWMTQKIMATVRAEADEKKSFFHRFFFPLRIKIPIQAIAVLFLAVTGFYIYQSIQLQERVSEAPIQEFASKKQAPSTGAAQDKADGPVPRPTPVPQTPAYKALDMKQEYESPPPPAPAEKAMEPAAPRPAGRPELARNEAALEKRAESQAAVLAGRKMQGQAEPSAGAALQAEGKQETTALKGKMKAASAIDGAGSAINITVAVTDLETAERDIEATIKQLGGTITKKEQLALKRTFTITLSANRADDLLTKLNRIGGVKEKTAPLESKENRIEFTIELVKTPK